MSRRWQVRLQNVFDCQVADLFIRRTFTGLMPGYVKGRPRHAAGSLCAPLAWPTLPANPLPRDAAAGYANCLRSYLNFDESTLQVKYAGKEFMEDPLVWSKRPLPPALLAYAAFDVSHLLQLRYAAGAGCAPDGPRG